jgi:flagellar biosynthesis protein FlhG
MLPIDDLPPAEANKIRMACAYLFSPEQIKDDRFIINLRFEEVRQAFAEKAKRYHPDLHGHESPEMVERRKERFIRIRESYETLKNYIVKETTPPIDRGKHRPAIIAVGGAKGGIGKSIFSANLAVSLSRMGRRTVLIDLDLGGANLHLYLGETTLPYTLNDFLSQRATKLEEIMVATRYGPKLIGGDSSRLGVANIDFVLKLKLLRSVKRIDADYIVLDLGGDTSYNVVDFFLSADHGLVLTTCDPTSYLEAYNFIKVSLFRKLNRLFGGESNLGVKKDPVLKELIEEFTLPKDGEKMKTIDQLIERIGRERPHYQSLIRGIASKFRPFLLVTMVESDSEAIALVKRIQEVARKMLSIHVEHLGNLPYQSEIKWSARDLVPVVAKFPGGYLSTLLTQWIGKIA